MLWARQDPERFGISGTVTGDGDIENGSAVAACGTCTLGIVRRLAASGGRCLQPASTNHY
jgi:ribosomal protein L18E